MNKLSFNQQMILCIVLMFIGFALGTVTEIGWFHNAALMLCGLIWVIHPVPPHLRELQPTAQWEVRIGGIILIIGSLLVRFGHKRRTSREVLFLIIQRKTVQSGSGRTCPTE